MSEIKDEFPLPLIALKSRKLPLMGNLMGSLDSPLNLYNHTYNIFKVNVRPCYATHNIQTFFSMNKYRETFPYP